MEEEEEGRDQSKTEKKNINREQVVHKFSINCGL